MSWTQEKLIRAAARNAGCWMTTKMTYAKSQLDKFEEVLREAETDKSPERFEGGLVEHKRVLDMSGAHGG